MKDINREEKVNSASHMKVSPEKTVYIKLNVGPTHDRLIVLYSMLL